MADEPEVKKRDIDYTGQPPVDFKRTNTLTNYLILNTAQFLNSFSQVAESKLHLVDEKLDEIETIISLYEAKMESMPEEFFDNLPPVPIVKSIAVMDKVENPLMKAKETKKTALVIKEGAKKENAGYVPPPPPNGVKINAPAGMPPVKVYPVTPGPQPAMMTIPNIGAAENQPQEEG
jgi:hypothetical protein